MKSRRRQLLRLGAFGAGLGFARPSAPTFTVVAGVEDGELVIDITALPASWGDLTIPGDGLGELGYIQWWNAVDGWQTLVDPADTGEVTVSVYPSLWGTEQTIRVRGVSDAGRIGTAAIDTVTPPGAAQQLAFVVSSGVQVTSTGNIVVAFIAA